MEFLRILEGLRVPPVTEFMSAITYCGDEIFFMVLAISVFWCISKRDGYYILLLGFLGTIGCQFLKLWFRIPRPWVLDPQFTIVESARAAAGGYSFPSGHTQNIVGTMSCVVLMTRRKWIRGLATALMLLVPFSRMYLGCHTPLDVGVAFLTAVLLALVLRRPVLKSEEDPAILWKLLFLSLLVAVLYLGFVHFYRFPADVDPQNLQEGIKNAYTLLGCLLGMLAVKAVDDRYIHFQTEAPWPGQLLKLLLGLALLMGIRVSLKAVLALFLPEMPAQMIRYGVMVFFAGAVWPLTFGSFARLGGRICARFQGHR